MHTIKKPYLVYFDFHKFENNLIDIEMLHRECWLDSIRVRPQAYPLFNSYGVSFAVS